MKNYILAYLTLTIMIMPSCGEDRMNVEDVKLWTQNDLDEYSNELLDLVSINSPITLSYDVKDIRSLRNIEEISGMLKIQSKYLMNLDMLANLRKVNALIISEASQLIEIDLPNLTTIDTHLIITGNDKLRSISFQSLELIGNGIDIVNNKKIISFKSPNLNDYGGLNIRYNPEFSYLEMNSPIPERASYRIQLEFKNMRSSETLFRNSKRYVNIDLMIENIEDSDLTWIKNIDPQAFESLNIYGDSEVSNFCDLKQMLQKTVHPSNFQIYTGLYERNFDGSDIINQCN